MAGQREGPGARRGETQERESSSAQRGGDDQTQNHASGTEGSGGSERGESQGKQDGSGEPGREKQQPSRAEWVVGIVCAIVVLAAVGYLFYEALSGPSTPPMITVRVEQVVPMRSGGYVVEIRARNEGSSTASSLHVEGTLMRDTTTVEKSSATINFVPAETEREAGLFFTKDPRKYRLEVRPTGFDRP